MAFGYGTHRVIFRSVFGAATFRGGPQTQKAARGRGRCSNPFSVSAGNLIPPVSLFPVRRPTISDLKPSQGGREGGEKQRSFVGAVRAVYRAFNSTVTVGIYLS